jgi:hypothetical protein
VNNDPGLKKKYEDAKKNVVRGIAPGVSPLKPGLKVRIKSLG